MPDLADRLRSFPQFSDPHDEVSMILNDYELAALYSANGDDSKIQELDDDATQKLVGMNLIAKDSSADGAGYVITDAGKRFLETNANNRGIV